MIPHVSNASQVDTFPLDWNPLYFPKASGPISITLLSETELPYVRTNWNLLLAESEANECFLLWEWIHSWWQVYQNANRRLLILAGKNWAGETVGIAPFYIEKEDVLGVRTMKVIRFCSYTDTNPDHLDVIVRRGYEEFFFRALLDYLKENCREWDFIRLDGLSEKSLLGKFFTPAAFGDDFILECLPGSRCPYLTIESDFQDYIMGFSRGKRHNLLKKCRRLLNGERVSSKIVSREEDPETYLQDLFAVHAERANRKGWVTTFQGRETNLFHTTFIEYLLPHDKIILSSIYDGPAPLSFYYCIKHNKKYYLYQTGLSSEGENRSAGVVLISSLIEKAFHEASREFDFLRGDEEYKYFWTKTFRRNYSLVVRKNNLFDRSWCQYLRHCGRM